jgi:hypothetical protein
MADWTKRTRAVHAGIRRSQFGELSEAIFLTQGFVYDTAESAEARFVEAGPDEFIYARYGNPTTAMFESRMAALEGAEDAFATASGMAAVSGALMAMLRAGDHVVSSRALFGSCLYVLEEVLRRFGVEVTFVDGTDLDQWRAAIRPAPRLCSSRPVSNPTLEVNRRAGVADLAHAAGRAGDRRQRLRDARLLPRVELGADVVVYSTTKHVDGQGRALGGIVLGTKQVHPQDPGALPEAHGWRDVALHRLDHAQGPGDDGPPRPRPGRDRALARPGAGGAPQPVPRDLSGPRLPPPARDSVAQNGSGRHGAEHRSWPRARAAFPLPQPRSGIAIISTTWAIAKSSRHPTLLHHHHACRRTEATRASPRPRPPDLRIEDRADLLATPGGARRRPGSHRPATPPIRLLSFVPCHAVPIGCCA